MCPTGLTNEDEQILLEALRAENAAAQSRRLTELCGDDQDRCERLTEYLALQKSADSLFAPIDSGTWLQGGLGVSEHATHGSALATDSPQRSVVGKFELLQTLGSGGMGTVFLARDVNLDRTVALKVPRPEVLADPDNRRRFLQEARVAAKLRHPNVVSVLEVGSSGPLTYIASEWYPPGDLAAWLEMQNSPSTVTDVAAFVATICEAIHDCHESGVVHLDLKPSNIMLRRSGGDQPRAGAADDISDAENVTHLSLDQLEPMVTDFGTCSLLDARVTRTTTGFLLGTPLYMAPEQFDPATGAVGPRSDVYALGIVLIELLGLDLPRASQTYVEIINAVRDDEFPQPADASSGIPEDMQTIISNCIARAPTDRYLSAQDLAADLRALASGKSISATPFGTTDSVRAWARNRARIREACLLSIFLNMITLVWIGFGMVTIFGSDFPGNSRTAAFLGCFAVTVFFTLPMFSLGLSGLRGKIWPVCGGVVLSGIMTLTAGLVLIGVIDAIPGMYDNSPFFEALNHLMILSLGASQLAAFLVALYAHSNSPR